MKSMFDNYFGGRINSRAEMAEKIRNMKTDGGVIAETEKFLNSIDPKDYEFKPYSSETSFAPYVGDCVVR
ncbi:hypothetical protein ACOXVJ_27590 [Pseudomonas knackmussii]|uniref:hypothetical protein n=1 Tax=Pseudomonas knackmussii TaxID=65741 RepID=UPI003BC02573